VIAEEALQAANRKLSLLSRISSDHLRATASELIEDIGRLSGHCVNTAIRPLLEGMQERARTLVRHIQLSETYQNLGALPPEWIRVQEVLRAVDPGAGARDVSLRFWAERLEIFADPLFRDVLVHIVENALRHGGTVKNVVLSYRQVPGALELFIEDDGKGIPGEKKEAIFDYDSGKHAGLGLFICRQITDVTGMTIIETGQEGKGARFVIRVPEENYRIEGTSDKAPPFPLSSARHATRFPDPGSGSCSRQSFQLRTNCGWITTRRRETQPLTGSSQPSSVDRPSRSHAAGGIPTGSKWTPSSHPWNTGATGTRT